jgi:dienelactone hydrolase
MNLSIPWKRLAAAAALAAFALPAFAAMQAKTVEWKVGDRTFAGVLVYDDAGGKRPGLVMVPDWYGVTDSAIAKAKHIAGKDYVVLLTDVYGKGIRPKDGKAASAAVGEVAKDPAEWRARVNKALAVLRANALHAPLDPARIAAIGYCFGGSSVLELARSGADVAAVVTFHGGLDTSAPAKPGAVKASLLVLNGADDKGTAGDIAGFEKEMDDAGADWQFVNFSHTVHCFALPDANSPPGCKYNPLSAARAERMMHGFLAERFAAR